MSYVFRIHKQTGGNAPDPGNFQNGWNTSSYLAGQLLDEIEAGQNVGRMGTSIPSIFARPMLFQTAFNTISPLNYDRPGLNQQLISEVFDMLEFLYQNAGNRKLSTQEWATAEQITHLKNSKNKSLKRLGESLDSQLAKIGNPAKITFFFWEDVNTDGVKVKTLIGGTSMTTMVFTSPNWERKAKVNGWEFRRIDGSKFFDNDVRSLNNRNSSFRDMMFNLRMSFNDVFDNQCGGNNGMAKYIWESIARSGAQITTMTKADFLNTYPPIKNTYAGGLPICKTSPRIGGGYCIRPTVARYKNQTNAQNQAIQISVPMALNDDGLPGVDYVGGADFKPEYKIDEALVRTTRYFNRELPGDMGIEYPYLTVFDLLEDKIVKVSGSVDKEHFYTFFNGEATYLLPLKSLFFEFFNVRDLDTVNDHTGRKLVEITADNDGSVTVKINMPITDPVHRYIPLSKTYTVKDIIIQPKPVEIGFFPFYKVVGEPQLNVYNVMLAATEKDTLEFYTVTPDRIEPIHAQATVRTPGDRFLHNTKYYDVKGIIDFVEVNVGEGIKALVIPKMTEVNMGNIHFDFAIDFGTSNTFIAYKTTTSPDIKTLKFGNIDNGTGVANNDVQTVFLHTPSPTMIDTFQREFMLPTIGMEDSLAGFPIKTAVCEVKQFESVQSPKLFGNINVGFKFKNEISAGSIPNASYFTDLKWALEQSPGERIPTWRVLAFCKQILWLVKNKALLNGGDARFNVMLTFPESMIDRSTFLDKVADSGVWIDAEIEIGLSIPGFDRFADDVTESEAPYYMVVQGNDNMLNVDIGGGTTDMFLVRRLDKDGNVLPNVQARYLSVKFAADDLWGDGAGARLDGNGANGFVSYLRDRIQANNGNINGITQLVKRSSDIMAALFSNDDKFKTSIHIRQNNDLRSILLIHYTAILFAVGRLLNKFDAGIPKVLSFTGMGSKYLSLITTDPRRLTNFTGEVLKMLTGAPIPHNFKLDTHYRDAKEVTAKGVLSKANVLPAFHIPDANKESFVDLGCDNIGNLTYSQIRTGSEVNAIREDARKVFDKFIELLNNPGYGALTGKEFGFSIPHNMIDELKRVADGSFNNVQGAISSAHDLKAVTDNLFFWFLKDSLTQLSESAYQRTATASNGTN